jgi:hypothetical protein
MPAMGKISAVSQSSNDLILSIISGPFNSEEHFNIFSSDVIESCNFNVKAHIIGASHIIRFRFGDMEINEIFACMQMDMAPKKVSYGPFKNSSYEKITQRMGHIIYNFSAQTKCWEDGEDRLKEWEDRANAYGAKDDTIGLSYEFPRVDSIYPPKTVIMVAAEKSDIEVKTIHSYPNENNITFTNTTINIFQ